MAHIVERLDRPSAYMDRQFKGSSDKMSSSLDLSTTLYVGNLSFYTTEEQIYELFSKCGDIKRVIMGLDRFKKTPCGFCFVEYYNKEDALSCMKYLNGTKLDDRVIRTDIDPGYADGRQYGRGRSGGQVRDEHREDYDAGRGGWGARIRRERERELENKATYKTMDPVPEGAQKEFQAASINSGVNKRLREDDDDSPHKRTREAHDSHNPRFRSEEDSDDDDQ